MTIGQRIKEIRTQKGLSQRELGIRMNVSQQMIGQYENSTAFPKIDTLKKIAAALEIDTIELLNFEGAFFEKINEVEGFVDWDADFIRTKLTNSSNDIRKIKSITTDLLNNNSKLNNLLFEVTCKYFKPHNFDTLNTSQKADIYNCLYEHIEYNSNTNELDIFPRIPPQELIISYNKLNQYGKNEAIKRIKEMAELKEYTDLDKDNEDS